MTWQGARQDPQRRHIDLAVDAEGNRYTTHTFGFNGDPWRGATILTPGVVADLRKRGMLPLTELPTPATDEAAGADGRA